MAADKNEDGRVQYRDRYNTPPYLSLEQCQAICDKEERCNNFEYNSKHVETAAPQCEIWFDQEMKGLNHDILGEYMSVHCFVKKKREGYWESNNPIRNI